MPVVIVLLFVAPMIIHETTVFMVLSDQNSVHLIGPEILEHLKLVQIVFLKNEADC